MCIRDRICKEIDPWAGSYYVESLTNELVHKGWALIQEIESMGGIVFKGKKDKPKEENKIKTKAKKKTYITPFDNIWVPIKICVFPFSKSEMIRS